MKSVGYIVPLTVVVLLLGSCVGLPPVFPEQSAAVRGVGQAVGALPEATVEPPASGEQAAGVGGESAGVTSTTAVTTTGGITTTAPLEAPATPTEEQVMGANPLTGVVWEWTALLKTKPAVQSVVPDPSAYTLIFADDGSVLIKADCNNATGTYTLANDQLVITIGGVTRVACPPGSFSNLMLTSLASVGSYLIDSGDLILRLADNGGSMLFRDGGSSAVPAAPPATEAPAGAPPAQTPAAPAGSSAQATTLIGPVWQWEQYIDVATGKSKIDVKNPGSYTATFKANNTVDMKADCNQAAGKYTVDGAKLTISIGPVTLAACGPGSLGEEFLIGLTSAASYSIRDGKLTIDLMADGGRMVFGAK